MIPESFINQIAEKNRISPNELAVLRYAIQGESMDAIASRLGNVTKEAVQKRMGEVYRKFDLTGRGHGKLAKLQQKLIMEYQQSLQQSGDLTESLLSVNEKDEVIPMLNDHQTEIFLLNFQELSTEETQIIYTLACADKPLTLEQLQTRIILNDDFSELLIKIGEMLKRQLVQKTVQEAVITFYLTPDLIEDVIYYLNEKVRQIATFNELEQLDNQVILAKLGIAKKSINQEQLSQLSQQISKNLNRLGYQQYLEGDLKSAKFNFLIGIKLNPNLASAHYNLGSTYEQLQDQESAKNHYEIALSLDNHKNSKLAALCNLARLDILSGDIEQCIQKIEPILEQENQEIKPVIQANLLKNLAWAYFLENRYAEAANCLQKAFKLSPNKPFFHGLMAQILEAQAQTEEALISWQNCLDNWENEQENERWQPLELIQIIAEAKRKIKSS